MSERTRFVKDQKNEQERFNKAAKKHAKDGNIRKARIASGYAQYHGDLANSYRNPLVKLWRWIFRIN